MNAPSAALSEVRKYLLIFLNLLVFPGASAQSPVVSDAYLRMDAASAAPLYTTYTAAMERSRLYGDKGYRMSYDDPGLPVMYEGDQAGALYTVFMDNRVVFDQVADLTDPPVVVASFPDMAILEYTLMPGIKVRETFFVYSSSLAMVQLDLTNQGPERHQIDIYPVLRLDNRRLSLLQVDQNNHALITRHHETKKRLISNLYANAPYPEETRDVLAFDTAWVSWGGYLGSGKEFYNEIKTDWYAENRSDSLNMQQEGDFDFVALHTRLVLQSGEHRMIRYFRGWQPLDEDVSLVFDQMNRLRNGSLQPYLNNNIRLFSGIPRIEFETTREKQVYLSAFNLLRGCMLPPTGKTTHNFYVFSRQPLWGWGHGHQVQHESLAMLAYAFLDPVSAEESQRVYFEQQGDDGLIPYRVGPRGPQTYPHRGKPTTSSPFMSWTNLEIYRISRDSVFLEEAYHAGMKYLNWLRKNRDTDHDGLFEWGPYGLIENVRDWYNVIFQVSEERHLDIDKEDISDELEDLDLTVMVINEARSLKAMAEELGRKNEARRLARFAEKTARLVNQTMWDDTTGFYYHVDKTAHSFRFMTRDLRRQEIIGFLPLWAGVASPQQAEILVRKLTDTTKFWRPYGVPTLAADDPWFNPYVDYCCKWNGPVWLLWDYMVYRGLLNYGYKTEAGQLAGKMMHAVTVQLSKNHNFWESYSPDNTTLNSPSNYIWDGIMARLLIDVYADPEVRAAYRDEMVKFEQ